MVDFAELGEFIDLKLKNYSSGMLVRLGFSLMTQVDADVLLIDEVLAVGDASFQQKCFDVFSDLHAEGRTIVLVTHDMAAVERHCDRAILLEERRDRRSSGDPGDVARALPASQLRRQTLDAAQTEDLVAGDAGIRALSATCASIGAPASAAGELRPGRRPIRLEVVVEAVHRLDEPAFGFQIVQRRRLWSSPRWPIRRSTAGTARAGRAVPAEGDDRQPARLRATTSSTAPSATRRSGTTVAFRKNAADFIVFGTGGFGGVVALEQRR